MYKKTTFLLLIFILASTFRLEAQYVTIGPGVYGGTNFYGPCYSQNRDTSHNRAVYLYPYSLFGSLEHGDTISSLGFRRDGTQALSGYASMRILLKLTNDTVFPTTNYNWFFESMDTAVKEVYNDDPTSAIGNTAGFAKFVFNKQKFRYDTTKGKNLQVFVEYMQYDALGTRINWYFDNSTTVTAYKNNQSKFVNWSDSIQWQQWTTGTSDRRPQMRIYFPRYNKDVAVNKLYSLGKLPVPVGNPDSLIAIVENTGKQRLDTAWFYLSSNGANKELDSFFIEDLEVGEQRYFKTPSLSPSNFGIDTLSLRAKQDGNPNNNIQYSYREATKNLYSYKDPLLLPNQGGIGFNGATGDFVAKFYSNSQKVLNQVSVNFGVLNRPFQLGIWAANGTNGTPGTLLYLSDTQLSIRNFTVLPVVPFLKVNGNFYVGIRQVGTQNIAFGYQDENPVRRNTFLYTSPAGSTNWTDFAPASPFKFMIEPRLQEKYDVAPIELVQPEDTFYTILLDTIAPKATIINYGWADQTTAFNTTMEVFRGTTSIYSDIQSDTLSAGVSRQLNFDKSLLFPDYGNYTIRLITHSTQDSVKQNDTLITPVHIPVYKEIRTVSIDIPSVDIEYSDRDTLAPKVTIRHAGIRNQPMGFEARLFIYADNGGTLIYNEAIRDTLNPFDTVQYTFKRSFFPTTLYSYITRVIITPDTFSKNDTFSSGFDVYKNLDVQPAFVYSPEHKGVYELNVDTLYTAISVRNNSTFNANFFYCTYELFDSFGNRLWRDSTGLSLGAGLPTIVDGPMIVCDQEGEFELRIYTNLVGDQYPENDTLIITYKVIKSNDVGIQWTTLPADGQVIDHSNTPFFPTAMVKNYGLKAQNGFDAHMKIWRNDTLVYDKKGSGPVLDVNDSVSFTFGFFRPNVKGYYDLEVYTSLEEDQVHDNDTFRSKFTVGAPHDIVPLAILMPQNDSIYNQSISTVLPKVRLINDGFLDVTTPFNLHFKAFSAGQEFYSDVKSMTALNSGETKELEFDNNFSPTKAGRVDVLVYSSLGTDNRPNNDSIWIKIFTVKEKDLAMEYVVEPNGIDSILVNLESINPFVRLQNVGVKPVNNPWNVVCTITDPNNLEVYRDTTIVTSLDTGKGRGVFHTNVFTPKTEGWHRAHFVSELEDDQDPDNDSISMPFYALVKYDFAPVKVLYPANEQHIQKHATLEIAPTVEIEQKANYAIQDSVRAKIEISFEGNLLYEDEWQGSLKAIEKKLITFTNTLSRQQDGTYDVLLYTSYANEQNLPNDTLRSTFIIDKLDFLPELKGKKVAVFPNPVKGSEWLSIEANMTSETNVALYDVYGRLVSAQLKRDGQKVLLPSIAPGTYILTWPQDGVMYRANLQVIE